MADFVQTMKDWKRMCDKYFIGENWECDKMCPLYKYEVCSKPTAKYPVPLDIGQDLAREIDCVIMAWAKENPEPMYPAWRDWLRDLYGNPNMTMTDILESSIDPEIARRLDIVPRRAR